MGKKTDFPAKPLIRYFSPDSEACSVESTMKPSEARRIAGASTLEIGSTPYLRCASIIPATAPGTPDAFGPIMLSPVSLPFGPTYMSRVAARGAVSR